jgi:hypothetical protein
MGREIMKAYITCPVSHTSKRLKLLPLIEKVVKTKGIEPFVFKIGGKPADIFQRDLEALKSSDILIAEVSERSHGVGIEIGISYNFVLKRILLIEKGGFVTKLAEGMPDTQIIEYSDEADLIAKLGEAL